MVRRHVRAGLLSTPEANGAIEDLIDLPLSVFPTAPLLRRTWILRHSMTAYDASYVALAEALGCPLLTADARLANAPGAQCTVEVV